MRFLHTADWHIGKKLNGFSLLEDQVATFQRIGQVAKQEGVDAIVIAGDLYDRSVPSEVAVKTLNRMLYRLNLVDHLPVLAISGNHDSAIRLGTGAHWFAKEGLYVSTTLSTAFHPVTIGDTQFFLLPFLGIQEARNYFEDDQIKDVNQAMERIVAAMKKQFAPNKKHVLVAHFFAAGSKRTADSETLVEVGGLSAVATSTLTPFDYVALGHLHNRQALQESRIKYSGSPLKFSVSEACQEKGVWVVDTNPFAARWIPLPPVHDIHLLKGTFADLVDQHSDYPHDDFYDIELADQERIPDVLNRLREYYPRIVSLHRSHIAQTVDQVASKRRIKEDPLELLADFYQQTMGTALTPQQKKWARETLKTAEEEN